MKKSTILPLLGVIFGLGLIASSFYWTSPLGPQPQWTEQQALEYQKAGAEYHRAKGHQHDESDDAGHAPDRENDEVRDARQQWERRDAMLQAIQSGHKRVALTLWWSGVAIAALGVVGAMFVRPQSE